MNHINGIKDDDRAENLEWATGSENVNHAIQTGLKKFKKGKDHPNYGKQVFPKETLGLHWKGKFGESHPAYGKTGSLNAGAKMVLNRETGIFYECIKEAAETINFDKSTLAKKLKGKRKNNTSFILV